MSCDYLGLGMRL